jgi:hypothetical protein
MSLLYLFAATKTGCAAVGRLIGLKPRPDAWLHHHTIRMILDVCDAITEAMLTFVSDWTRVSSPPLEPRKRRHENCPR